MKKRISRNIAIISAIFVVVFSTMLITNYFQVQGSDTLKSEVIETLKQLNDENASEQLQSQIRELDLLARKAYFISQDRLKTGSIILVVMILIFVVSSRLYYAKDKNIPDKELDPIDEWANKTIARRYVTWGAIGLAAVALGFVFLTSPYLNSAGEKQQEQSDSTQLATIETTDSLPEAGNIIADTTSSEETKEIEDETKKDSTATEEIEVSKITHNGFRGNYSSGVTYARGVPTSWNLASGKNIAWKSKVPRKGYNSPVINGNKVFISGADQQARELYCYELSSGKLLWTLTAANIAGSPAQMPKTTDDTGLAASTVATNGKQVCAIFASGDIICADMDGKQLWAKNLGVPVNHYGYSSSLLAYGGALIIQMDNGNGAKVMALDMATGGVWWSKTRPDKISWSSPIITTVGNKPQLILMGNPAITSYNPNNGEQLWRVECMTGEVGSSPVAANGIVFGASEYATLVAINAEDGTKLWEMNDYLPEVSSPVATKNNVFLATSYGVVACFDAKTGELGKVHELSTEFYSSPMIAEGRIYLFSNDGKMHIFSANSDFNLISSFDTGERTFATPAFTDGKIVVRTENGIYCVSAK